MRATIPPRGERDQFVLQADALCLGPIDYAPLVRRCRSEPSFNVSECVRERVRKCVVIACVREIMRAWVCERVRACVRTLRRCCSRSRCSSLVASSV